MKLWSFYTLECWRRDQLHWTGSKMESSLRKSCKSFDCSSPLTKLRKFSGHIRPSLWTEHRNFWSVLSLSIFFLKIMSIMLCIKNVSSLGFSNALSCSSKICLKVTFGFVKYISKLSLALLWWKIFISYMVSFSTKDSKFSSHFWAFYVLFWVTKNRKNGNS